MNTNTPKSKNRPYYLKVVNNDNDEDIQYFIRRYDNHIYNTEKNNQTSPLVVGIFHELFRLSKDTYILTLYPYYKNKGDALRAALKLLNDNGYKAKEIKLEEFIESIDMEEVNPAERRDMLIDVTSGSDIEYLFVDNPNGMAERMHGDVKEHRHAGREFWHPVDRKHTSRQ